jgi:hypothetical protein
MSQQESEKNTKELLKLEINIEKITQLKLKGTGARGLVVLVSFIMFIVTFFTFALLADLHYSCVRTIHFVIPLVVIHVTKQHHH